MNWFRAEYIFKGLFLGLMLYAALDQAAVPPGDKTWTNFAWINGAAAVGLAAALALAAGIKLRQGFRTRGKLHLFLLFLLLESPWLIYLGVFAGSIFGIYWIHSGSWDDPLLLPILGSGAVFGVVMALVRQTPHKLMRLTYGLILAAVAAAGVLFWLGQFGDFGQLPKLPSLNLGSQGQPLTQIVFATQMLAGAVMLYMLVVAGREDESEVDAAAVCCGLAVSVGIYTRTFLGGESLEHIGYIFYLIPLGMYFVYAVRALPWLRVVKHSFRGLSFARVGRYRRALQSLRRALQLDPNNKLAREGFWDIHQSLDLNAVANDPQTLALVDLDLCLERAGSLLVQGTPSTAQLTEAHRLLDLAQRLRPALQPPIDYWRAVAHTHAHQYDEAAAELARLLDTTHYGRDNPQRLSVLLPAWQMGLTLSEELRKRVGLPQLGQPGRRMEAIAAAERRLADRSEDEAAWGLKRILYSELTEPEYFQTMGDQSPSPGAPPAFDYNYVQQLGLALIDDGVRWQRGGEYLRMAAHGMPTLGPTLFLQIAQAQPRVGKVEEARHNL